MNSIDAASRPPNSEPNAATSALFSAALAAAMLVTAALIALEPVDSQPQPTLTAARADRQPQRTSIAAHTAAAGRIDVPTPRHTQAPESIAQAESKRLRIHGTRAGLRLFEDALRGLPKVPVELVRSNVPPLPDSSDCDIAILLTRHGERPPLLPFETIYLGDFTPAVIRKEGPPEDGAPILVPRRWVPILELCFAAPLNAGATRLRRVSNLRVIHDGWHHQTGARAVVSLAALRSFEWRPVALTLDPSRFFGSSRDPDAATPVTDLRVEIALPRRTPAVDAMLEHLTHGHGRAQLDALLH